MRTLIAFAVLSIIAAMMFTLDTTEAAEAHLRSTPRIWRCPPCIYPSQYWDGYSGYPERSDWPVCTPRYRWWPGYWYWDCF